MRLGICLFYGIKSRLTAQTIFSAILLKRKYKSFYQNQKCNMCNKDEIDHYYKFIIDLTKQAGSLIRDRIHKEKHVEMKASNIDFVTETDQEVEKLLITTLSKEFPTHKFIGEESVSSGAQCNLTCEPTWIIDPVDGTMNFVHGFPHSCISVGLFMNFEPVIGVIYNPVLEQLFTARKGKGAFLNGERIKVSGQTKLENALLMTENGTSRDPDKIKALYENYTKLVPIVHGTRSLGSAALNIAMVAMGGADVYYEFGLHIWDFAAGEVIIKEAGGVMMDPTGAPIDRMSRRMLCASSLELAEQVSQRLVQYYPQPRD